MPSPSRALVLTNWLAVSSIPQIHNAFSSRVISKSSHLLLSSCGYSPFYFALSCTHYIALHSSPPPPPRLSTVNTLPKKDFAASSTMSPPKMIKWQDPSEIIEDWENWLSERIHTPPEPSSQASAVDIDPDFKTFVHLSELDEEKCTKVTDSLLLHIDSATHQDDWVSWFHLACLQAFLAKRADPTATLGAQYLFSILNELWGSHGRKALLFLKFLEGMYGYSSDISKL